MKFEKANMLKELKKIDNDFRDSNNYKTLFGASSSLGFPSNTSIQRIAMLNKHCNHRICINSPEFPRIYTGAENQTGNSSNYVVKYNNPVIIKNIILKFPNVNFQKSIFVKDQITNEYDVIHVSYGKSLTEHHGFKYNLDSIDYYQINDIIKPNTKIVKSTSYDEYDNYGYGVNATVGLFCNSSLIEDSTVVSESFAKKLNSISVSTIAMNISNDSVLLNLYGDKDNYKAFPDLDGKSKIKNGIFAAMRKTNHNSITYNTNRSLMIINDLNDLIYYNNGILTDISIYANAPFVDNIPMHQLYTYYQYQQTYYKDCYKYIKKLIDDNCNISYNIRKLFHDSKQFIDEDSKWVSKSGEVFSYLHVKFTIFTENKCEIGQKITGRCGNKSIISNIVPDDQVPKDKNGKPIDIQMNALSIFDRNIPFVLYELSITRIMKKIQEKIIDLGKDYSEKFNYLIKFMEIFNKGEKNNLIEIYNNKNDKGKKLFWKSIEENGLYLNITSFYHTDNLYLKIIKCWEVFPELKLDDPDDYYVYNQSRGEYIKIFKDTYIGELYIMKLKQDAIHGFSARCAGAISEEQLPIKTYGKKNHNIKYSNTAVRSGEYEEPIISIGCDINNFAKFNLFYRTSPTCRQWFSKYMLDDNTPLPREIENRSAEINNVYFKALGITLDINDDIDEIINDDDDPQIFTFNDTMITCKPSEVYQIKKILKSYIKIDHEYPDLKNEDPDKFWEIVFNQSNNFVEISDYAKTISKTYIDSLMVYYKNNLLK